MPETKQPETRNEQNDDQSFETQGDRNQARQRVQESIQTGQDAVSQLVRGWAEALRSAVPGAWLRPSEAFDFAYDVAEQVVSLQRRLAQELLGAARSNADAMRNAADDDGQDRQNNGGGGERRRAGQTRR